MMEPKSELGPRSRPYVAANVELWRNHISYYEGKGPNNIRDHAKQQAAQTQIAMEADSAPLWRVANTVDTLAISHGALKYVNGWRGAYRSTIGLTDNIATPVRSIAPKTSTVNRIEGGASRERFIIDEAGNVTITRPRGRARRGVNISLSFDDTARQSSLAVRDSRTGAVIKTFEVRKEFADKVRRIAVPEQPGGRHKFPGLPFRVDKKYRDAFQIPPEMFDELESAIIPGTGRVIQPGS